MSTIIVTEKPGRQPKSEQRKRGLLFGAKRGLKWFGIGLLALCGLGAIYQTIATEADKRNFPAPGQMVDMGGYGLHLQIMGRDTGSPTVILESGLGFPSTEWALVQPEIAKFTQVVSYDRSGLGWSEDGGQPHDALHIARQLHTALHNAGIGGPYVFVGHSVGGLYARAFAEQYPDEVVGLVLIDATTPRQFQIPELVKGQQTLVSLFQIMYPLSYLGIPRLIDLPGILMDVGEPGIVAEFPSEHMGEMRAVWATPRHLKSLSAEVDVLLNSSVTQVGGERSLGGIPVVILTALKGAVNGWNKAQSEMVALSTNSVHYVYNDYSHSSFTLDADRMDVTIDAVRQVIESAQTGNPLASK